MQARFIVWAPLDLLPTGFMPFSSLFLTSNVDTSDSVAIVETSDSVAIFVTNEASSEYKLVFA